LKELAPHASGCKLVLNWQLIMVAEIWFGRRCRKLCMGKGCSSLMHLCSLSLSGNLVEIAVDVTTLQLQR
jgi:hypothetical protein